MDGEPAWQDVPGEYRALLRRLVVIQGDTEPASVEQQRYLGKTAPSLYDMRNLSEGYRVVSLLGLGALLMAVSFAYQKDWLNLHGAEGANGAGGQTDAESGVER